MLRDDHKNIIERAKVAGCILCQSTSNLHFHHRNPNDKSFYICSYSITVSTKELREELDKCAVLCASCHSRIHGSNSPPDWMVNKALYLLLQDEAGPDGSISPRDRSLAIMRARGKRV